VTVREIRHRPITTWRHAAACGAAWLALCVLCPAVARAHPAIDRARARFDEADFPAALEALERAERGTGLTVDDVAALLELRALASLANGDPAGMQRALGRDAPPEVAQSWTRARARSAGEPRVAVSTRRHGELLEVSAQVENDPNELVRTFSLSVRVDHGAWQEAPGGSIALEAPVGARVEYWATAVGPGGAPLAQEGTAAAPRRVIELAPGEDGNGSGDDRGGGGISPWVWVALGAAVLVGAGVAVGLAAASSGGQSDITRPMLPIVILD